MDIPKLIVALIFTLGVGFIGSLFTTPNIANWYRKLKKPTFNPPNWVFAPVWTLLYILMGVAAFLVWRRGWENRQVKIALVAFLVQLILNASWSVVFFGLESPLYGLIVIAALWVAIIHYLELLQDIQGCRCAYVALSALGNFCGGS